MLYVTAVKNIEDSKAVSVLITALVLYSVLGNFLNFTALLIALCYCSEKNIEDSKAVSVLITALDCYGLGYAGPRLT